jgi:hypothetical protein
MLTGITRWIMVVMGLVVAGEALALLVGMNLPRPSEWSTLKNNGLALVDVVTGVLLVVLLFCWKDVLSSLLLHVLLITVVASHGYREWEYTANGPNRFCANVPLFVLNSIKLVGSMLHWQ